MFGNSFGGLAGLGGVPQRRTAPNSQVVDAPFADWGNAANWQTDWQNRYDAEMLKDIAPVFQRPVYDTRQYDVQSNAGGGSSYRDGQTEQTAWGTSSYSPTMTSQPNRVTDRRYLGMGDYTPPGDWRNLGPLYEEQRRLQGAAENQMRNQQAYQWMEGGGQRNAVMSPDYANAGFNQITGLMNPYGPTPGAAANVMGGQNPDISMDFATGAYDPSTQRGTGAYQTNAMRQRSGW